MSGDKRLQEGITADMLNENLPLLGLMPDIVLRLGTATVAGLALGLDRELRGSAAGLRTHGLIALSAAVLTISSLLLFYQLRQPGAQPDPLRVIEGLATALGIIAAGLIFVQSGTVQNLTSAAHIWLTTTIGIACGAGQYALVAVGIVLGLVMLSLLRLAEKYLLETKPPEDKPVEQGRNDPDKSTGPNSPAGHSP
ncbi:MgtC/SapB family protein [Rhizorhapis suberifaciens]|uniref:Protein MgtC n=1 Tax=Rhizorhapis suberifaciens TaxID=13656 RepID=A0A840HSE2_9SPHN|nr:MgtC/SapB family protein [Rhizorhapis suberifaciens]MBB4641082.1 putative Mg2+ transporter-C (MgtC) family protein [Rhizorhapis suberifaciens]